MNGYEFIYIVGMTVSFVMIFVWLSRDFKNEVIGLIICSLLGSILSWGLPIWWIGMKINEYIKSRKI